MPNVTGRKECLTNQKKTKMMHVDDVEGAMQSVFQSRLLKLPPKKNAPAPKKKRIPDSVTAMIDPFHPQPDSAAMQDGSRSEEKAQAAEDSLIVEAENQQRHAVELLEVAEEVVDQEEDKATEENDLNDSDEQSVSSKSDSSAHSKEERDDGVPDSIWDELQIAKKEDKLSKQEMSALKKDLEAATRREEKARLACKEKLRRLQEEQERLEKETDRQKAEKEKQKYLEEEKRRIEAEIGRQREKEKKRRREAELERKRKEEVLREMEEAKQTKEKIQQKLKKIGKCPMGFVWRQCGGGWRCSAGGHFVSNEQLNYKFG